MTPEKEMQNLGAEQSPPKKDRRKLYIRLVRIAAVAVIVISLLYILITFLTHGHSDGTNPYRVAWLRGLTAGGGLYSDTVPQGSAGAITAAAEDGNYNLLLDVVPDENGTLMLDYEQSYPLSEALALTTDGKCNVIIQINGGGAKAAQTLCDLLTETGYQGNLAVQSEDIEVLAWLEDNRPHVIRGLVTGALEDSDMSGFEKFCHRNMLLNFKCRPYYTVCDASMLPTVASHFIRSQMLVLASNTSDINDITKLGEDVDGFILEGYSFE